MTATKTPGPKEPPKQAKADPEEAYRLRTLEQILTLFDGGDFLAELLEGHRQLQMDLVAHKAEHGVKGCQGSMTIKVNYALGKSGDLAMGAKVSFDAPSKPPASATAYISEDGTISLFSPMLARMQKPVRDVSEYDPETGEIFDPE